MVAKAGSKSLIRNQAQAAKGMEQIKKVLEAKLREAVILTKEGVEDVVKEIEFESNLRVPVDTRTLMDSSYKQVIDLGGGKVVGEVGYDRNGEAPYASYVHEINANHSIGQWKLLLAGSNAVETKIPRL